MGSCGGERFNIEAAGRGGNRFEDDYFRADGLSVLGFAMLWAIDAGFNRRHATS